MTFARRKKWNAIRKRRRMSEQRRLQGKKEKKS